MSTQALSLQVSTVTWPRTGQLWFFDTTVMLMVFIDGRPGGQVTSTGERASAQEGDRERKRCDLGEHLVTQSLWRFFCFDVSHTLH